MYYVKRAKEAAAIAIRDKKVFLCLGPYTPIRQSLRRRGWVEKNYKGPLGVLKPRKKHKRKNSKQSKLISKLYDATESDQSSSSDSDSDTEMPDQLVQAYREEFDNDEEYSMAVRRCGCFGRFMCCDNLGCWCLVTFCEADLSSFCLDVQAR